MYLYHVQVFAGGLYPYHSRPPFVVTTTLHLGVHGLLRPTLPGCGCQDDRSASPPLQLMLMISTRVNCFRALGICRDWGMLRGVRVGMLGERERGVCPALSRCIVARDQRSSHHQFHLVVVVVLGLSLKLVLD